MSGDGKSASRQIDPGGSGLSAVTCKTLPSRFEGFTLLHISDLHVDMIATPGIVATDISYQGAGWATLAPRLGSIKARDPARMHVRADADSPRVTPY
jgi:hypothetical protein